MKKPLQEENKSLFMGFDGQVRMHRASDAEILIKAVNLYLGKSDFERKISITDDFECFLSAWMIRLVDKGITDTLVNELNMELKDIRFRHILMTPEGELPYWEYIADLKKYFGPKIEAAYAFSQQLAIGGFVGLKRCRMRNCPRFFIGRPDAKWCSKACGSKYRVSQKRKRDKSG